MTKMKKTFKTFDDGIDYKEQLKKDNNNTGFEYWYDWDIKMHILEWNHREEHRDQKTLEAY